MDYQITTIKKYKQIVDKRLCRYKKRQTQIWKTHLKVLTENISHYIYNVDGHRTIEQKWYSNCLWELKHQPSIKKKKEMFKANIEKKIHAYINILLKISCLNFDMMLNIVEYIC